MRLGYLRMICDTDPFSRVRFAEMAKSAGMTFEYPSFGSLHDIEGAKRGWASSKQLLDEADAFILDGLPLEHVQEFASRLHDRISAGARAVVFPYPGNREHLRWWQDFLERYNIRPSWVKLVGPRGERSGLTFRREENCFRDPELFAGVDTVLADSPFALWYGGEAWPVLVGSSAHWGVEASTDLPEDWNGREMACMAVWHGQTGGAVLVSYAYGILSDPVTLPLGGPRPGIELNGVFARNILRFLEHSKRNEPLTPSDLCKRIEINLVDFVFGVLKPIDKNWWVNCVPLTIRQEAAKRQEEERNKLTKEAYLDLIDLKAIIVKNWKLFEAHFTAFGRSGGREKALSFFDGLNEIRRLIGHPLKMHVSGYSFSREEQKLLAEVDSLALKLAECVRQSLS
jgi:hypothetical protein